MNVLSLTYFRIPFLKGIIFYMKNYSHSRPISYDITSLICYFQGQRIDHATFKFLILRGAGFEMCRIFRASHIIK